MNAFFKASQDEFPNTESDLYAILDRLEESPVMVTSSSGVDVQVSAVKFFAHIVSALRQTPYKATLPLEIQKIFATQTYQEVADSWISAVNSIFADEEAGSYHPSTGMSESVLSSFDAYYSSQQKIFDNIELHMPNPSIKAWAEVQFYYWHASVQRKWPVEPVSSNFQDPVVSDVPTLMLVGALDPATPPTFSEPSAQNLSNSFFVEILSGHATLFLQCVAEMIDDFVIKPDSEPEYTCETDYT